LGRQEVINRADFLGQQNYFVYYNGGYVSLQIFQKSIHYMTIRMNSTVTVDSG
jgi:hypothetical protein